MKMLNVFCLIFLVGCSYTPPFPEVYQFPIGDDSFSGSVVFQKLTSTIGFKVLLKNNDGIVVDQEVFRYLPYRFDTADVNRDRKTDILIGLIKSTRFDPTEKKRLFILRIDNAHLRPLWLGSKVCQELIDFRALPNGQIRTLERTYTGAYEIGQYYWQSFGLTLEKYIHHETSISHAKKIFLQ